MKVRFTQREHDTILALPRPDTHHIEKTDPAKAKAINTRVAALIDLVHGSSVNAISKRYGLHPKTLYRMIELAIQPGPQGEILGFAVCTPGARFGSPEPRTDAAPTVATSHAMTRLVSAVTELAAAIAKFTGPLPSKTQSSPAFDRLNKEMRRILKSGGIDTSYPFNTRDKGRRALANYIKRKRTEAADASMNLDAPPSLTRLDDLGVVDPFIETQFDAHWIDVKDQWTAIPLADGTYTVAPITGIWFLAKLDVGSRVCVAWHLVIGPAYDQFDFIQTLANALTVWSPRTLSGTHLAYLPNAWMPSSDGLPLIPLILSLDNFSGNIAKHARRVLLQNHHGVYHFGVAGIPQTRGTIEAFFKKMEREVFRFLAGGFEPETSNRAEQRISRRNPKDYPIFQDLLEDFIDVAVTTYNVKSHAKKNDRSPREVAERHLASGALVVQSTRSAPDAREMKKLHVEVTIRGKKSTGVLPHVNFGYATYRSDKLSTRWDLVGKKFSGFIEDTDARYLQLLDSSGETYALLKALPPYARSPHSLRMRRRAELWRRAKPTQDESIEDAIEAYHADVRERARTMKWAADAVASGKAPTTTTPATASTSPAIDPLVGLPPRGGPVRLR